MERLRVISAKTQHNETTTGRRVPGIRCPSADLHRGDVMISILMTCHLPVVRQGWTHRRASVFSEVRDIVRRAETDDRKGSGETHLGRECGSPLGPLAKNSMPVEKWPEHCDSYERFAGWRPNALHGWGQSRFSQVWSTYSGSEEQNSMSGTVKM